MKQHYDKPRESTAGVARPDSAPLPFEVVNVSAEGTPDARLQRPRHQLRHPGGKFARPGYGGYDAVTGCHMPDVRDHSVLRSPVPRPQPMATDWSGGPTFSEQAHAYQCGGPGRCAYPSFHFGQEDGAR